MTTSGRPPTESQASADRRQRVAEIVKFSQTFSNPAMRAHVMEIVQFHSELEAETEKVGRQVGAIGKGLKHEFVGFMRVVARLAKDTGIFIWMLILLKLSELAEHVLALADWMVRWLTCFHGVAMVITFAWLAIFAILDVVAERWGRNAE